MTKNITNAIEEGAKRGDSTCQTRLGKLLLFNKLDDAQAYFWLCEAAEQGDMIAKMWKGHCLFYGIGTRKDQGQGTDLLVDALNYNFPGSGSSQSMIEESQFDWEEDMLQMFWDLAIAYENGWGGMPKRDRLAGYYFDMVADGGWPEAREKMTHYKKGLLGNWKRIK